MFTAYDHLADVLTIGNLQFSPHLSSGVLEFLSIALLLLPV